MLDTEDIMAVVPEQPTPGYVIALYATQHLARCLDTRSPTDMGGVLEAIGIQRDFNSGLRQELLRILWDYRVGYDKMPDHVRNLRLKHEGSDEGQALEERIKSGTAWVQAIFGEGAQHCVASWVSGIAARKKESELIDQVYLDMYIATAKALDKAIQKYVPQGAPL